MTAPDRIWAHEPTIFDGMDVWQTTPAEHTTEYIRADLARPVTVAEAAKVLLGDPMALRELCSGADFVRFRLRALSHERGE